MRVQVLLISSLLIAPGSDIAYGQAQSNAEADVLTAAFDFFSPRGNQVRWIDPENMPAEMLEDVLPRLGTRFMRLDTARVKERQGGILRPANIEWVTPDTAHLNVQFQSVSPYYLGDPFNVRLEVIKRGNRWKARSH